MQNLCRCRRTGLGDHPGNFQADIQDDAFDEAVKNVDAVLHMASPFHFEADDPQELFVPAVNGTLGILKSVQKNNPKVQRVVITSSVAAIVSTNIKGPHTFTEKDWNQVSIPECEKKGREASNQDKYRGESGVRLRWGMTTSVADGIQRVRPWLNRRSGSLLKTRNQTGTERLSTRLWSVSPGFQFSLI